MFGRRRADDPTAPPRYPRRWRKDPPIGIDWELVRSRVVRIQVLAPEGLATVDQAQAAARDMIAGFGIDLNNARECFGVAVGICLLDTVIGWSDGIEEEVKEETGLLAGACALAVVPGGVQ